MASRNIISIMALEHYSLTTLLFPIATALACILLVQLVVIRRTILNNKLKKDQHGRSRNTFR
jgi:hypothetical protein